MRCSYSVWATLLNPFSLIPRLQPDVWMERTRHKSIVYVECFAFSVQMSAKSIYQDTRSNYWSFPGCHHSGQTALWDPVRQPRCHPSITRRGFFTKTELIRVAGEDKMALDAAPSHTYSGLWVSCCHPERSHCTPWPSATGFLPLLWAGPSYWTQGMWFHEMTQWKTTWVLLFLAG